MLSIGAKSTTLDDLEGPLRRGGFRHVQHVRPNMGPHKNGAPT